MPLVGGGEVVGLNLDYAASAPALRAVRDAVEAFLPWYSSVHRGAGFKSQVSTEAFEWARGEVAAFVGARPDDTVIFTRNTTDAINLLATALPLDALVITFASEHHANLLPWRRRECRHLEVPHDPLDIPSLLDEALRTAGARPTLVAVSGASNVTGEI
ncbi:MAG: aminotransferase class V-fold PLP-dependent enzyme [Mycobacteriales bacterium]